MALTVFNTQGRRKERFQPADEGRVRLYVCGPSTYDYAHIGHARSYVVYDAMRRYLEHLGYGVEHVMNFTDVEEEIGARAREAGVDPIAFAEGFIDAFNEDMDALRVLRPHHTPRVSENVDRIIRAAERLLESGHAYNVNGNIYLDVTQVEDFGDVSGQPLDAIAVGDAGQAGERKHPMDFALWKSKDDWGVTWPSPWGDGRPGWHVECTVMAQDILGPHFDVHGGGQDLIFPHHESEAAVGRALTGERYCKYYLHNGFVTLHNDKMSKSTGNFVTVRELLTRHDAEAVRAFLLSAHYRANLDYDEELVAAWQERLAAWRRDLDEVRCHASGAALAGEEIQSHLPEGVAQQRRAFFDALDDDFHFGKALDALHEAITRGGEAAREKTLGEGEGCAVLAFAREAAQVLGLLWDYEFPASGGE